MSASLKATKNRTTGRRSKRNFIRRAAFYQATASSLPAADGLAGRVVLGAHHQATRRHRDQVLRAFGHRDISGAAVECIGERHVLVIAARKGPEIDAGLCGEL